MHGHWDLDEYYVIRYLRGGFVTSSVKYDAGANPQSISLELRRISNCYGLHAPTGNPVSNEGTRAEFDRRVNVFLEKNLILTRDLPFTRRSISIVLDVQRKPVSREAEVSLAQLNELSLVWALDLLRLGYRGFTRPGVIDSLKREVVWLFSQYGHLLFGEHTLFCPFLNVWEKQKLWEMLKKNDLAMTESFAIDISTLLKIPVCSECILAHETSS